MTRFFSSRLHPSLAGLARARRRGEMDRREFLALSTALGLAAPLALRLAGPAAAATDADPPSSPLQPQAGGRLTLQMALPELQDPRLATRPQAANVLRGWLEYLIAYGEDGTFQPRLLDRWALSDDAREAVLHLRPGVRWSNGEPFVAAHVAFNLQRWCDSRVAGNSMAWRMASLIDPATGQLAEDALQIHDPLTLSLRMRQPDVTLIAGFADYPAAIVHPSFRPEDLITAPLGTGPYLPEHYTPGKSARLRREDAHWWGRGSGAWLTTIDYLDTGEDPQLIAEAAAAGRIQMTDASSAETARALDALGWESSSCQSAATMVARFNQSKAPYADVRVRRALLAAVDNQVVLELGLGARGTRGENHHVWPRHPDYAALPLSPPDPAEARRLLGEAGHSSTEFELISIDDEWQASSADAIVAQLTDAGIRARRRRLTTEAYWQNWRAHPWSVTEWNMRPLGIQCLALAYRSGSAWNETGFADPEFDRLLDEALGLSDPAARRPVMARLQEILVDQAVILQPFWRDLTRHFVAGLHGTAMHPMAEHHHTLWWRDAALLPDPPDAVEGGD